MKITQQATITIALPDSLPIRPAGSRLVLITQRSAQWIGMAASAAGGWVWTGPSDGLPLRCHREDETPREMGGYEVRLACLPAGITTLDGLEWPVEVE